MKTDAPLDIIVRRVSICMMRACASFQYLDETNPPFIVRTCGGVCSRAARGKSPPPPPPVLFPYTAIPRTQTDTI